MKMNRTKVKSLNFFNHNQSNNPRLVYNLSICLHNGCKSMPLPYPIGVINMYINCDH